MRGEKTSQPLKLSSTVSGNANPKPGDVVSVKQALAKTGDYRPPFGEINAILDREMIAGVRKFQRRQGLVTDGVMRPGGPTERLLKAAIGQGRQREAAAGLQSRVQHSVGFRGENDPTDVSTVRRMLRVTGHLGVKQSRVEVPLSVATAIGNLQRDYGLEVTSRLKPGDKTDKALRRELDLYARDEDASKVEQAMSNRRIADNLIDEPRTHDVAERFQNNPIARAIPKTAPPVPDYRRYAVSQDEFDAWHNSLKRAGVSPNLYYALMAFFAAEGGEDDDLVGSEKPEEVFAGVFHSSLKKVARDVPELAGKRPRELTHQERIMFFVELLRFDGDSKTFGYMKGGLSNLDRIIDPRAAEALIDTILGPNKTKNRIKIIQKAINDVVPGKVDPDNFFGNATFDAFAELANNPRTIKFLLDALADRRIDDARGSDRFEGRKVRFNHFRINHLSGRKLEPHSGRRLLGP